MEKGGDRQEVHELIRVDSFKAWDEVMQDRPNPLAKILSENKAISSKLKPAEVRKLLDPRHHTGDAEQRCEHLVKESIDPILARHKNRLEVSSKVEY